MVRRGRDSNPRYPFEYTHFPGVLLQPLGHLSFRFKDRKNKASGLTFRIFLKYIADKNFDKFLALPAIVLMYKEIRNDVKRQ